MNGFSPSDWDAARRLLCRLQDTIRDVVLAARVGGNTEALAAVAHVTTADTIYGIDKVSESAVIGWLGEHWPRNWPVQLVMEGIPDEAPLLFPAGTPAGATRLRLILDPIDGTRSLMYDKRSAWVLAGLAPQRGAGTTLADIQVAAMTELPTTKQWRADQISGVRGGGPAGIVAESVDVRSAARERAPLRLQPSRATDFRHGFASLARYFPEGKALTAQIEEDVWDALYGLGSTASPLVFDDQYICTGGQLYELLAGHDRMCGDLRPLVLPALGYTNSLCCHPYDICTALLLTEAGGVVEQPDGQPLDAPLNTESNVAWVGFANEGLAAQVRPVLRRALAERLGRKGGRPSTSFRRA